MNSDILILKINQAIQIEERAIPIYSKHLEKITNLTNIDEEKKKRIKSFLRQLKTESKNHEQKLEELKERILEDDKDEY